MKFEQVWDKITNKEYNSKLPYPPYRPDKIEKTKFKAQDAAMRQRHKEDKYKLQKIFEYDMMQACNEYLGVVLTNKQYVAVWNKAWEDGHAYGYSEVYNHFLNLIDVIEEFVNVNNT